MQSDALKVVEALSNTYSNTITLVLHETINADCTFIAATNEDGCSSKTIALVANDKITDNIEYSIEHSPFSNVVDNAVYYYPDNVSCIFPKDQ